MLLGNTTPSKQATIIDLISNHQSFCPAKHGLKIGIISKKKFASVQVYINKAHRIEIQNLINKWVNCFINGFFCRKHQGQKQLKISKQP